MVDLTGELGMAQATVSAHLACLRECGLVSSRRSGRASLYALSRPELRQLLDAAEAVVAATNSAVASCSTARQVPGNRRSDRRPRSSR